MLLVLRIHPRVWIWRGEFPSATDDAAQEKYPKVNIRMETKVNKGIAFPHANASEYHLREGDSFSFQIVINRRDYHQLMNRRRIKKLDAKVS